MGDARILGDQEGGMGDPGRAPVTALIAVSGPLCTLGAMTWRLVSSFRARWRRRFPDRSLPSFALAAVALAPVEQQVAGVRQDRDAVALFLDLGLGVQRRSQGGAGLP